MMCRLAAAALVVAAAASPAAAQTYRPEWNPDRFVLTADPNSVALVDAARPPETGQLSLGVALRYGAPPLELCVQDATGTCVEKGDIVSSRFGSDLVAAYGVRKLGVYAQLPVLLYQGGDFAPSDSMKLRTTSIGDLRVGGKAMVFDLGHDALALDLRAGLPTSRGQDLTGDSGVSIEGRVIAEHRVGKVSTALQGGWAWRQHPARIANLYVANEVLWAAAAEYAITPKRLSAGASVFGRVGVDKDPMPPAGTTAKPGWEERPVEVMGSGKLRITDDFVVESGVAFGVTNGYGPGVRALLGMRYAPLHEVKPKPRTDRDGDGYYDDVDKCPDDPEDFDKFQDEDGCPEPDNDKDLILDKDDKCPNDPEDRDGFEDEDGCAELDNDKDGILDKDDKCPNDPEDKDGFQDEDGCPDPDNDNDGILDKDDKCPNDPETRNAYQDEDGCPDEIPPQVKQFMGVIAGINFKVDSAELLKTSFKVLDDAVIVLKEYPDVKLEINGHTDDQPIHKGGKYKDNQELSDARAASVRAYLIKQGVAEDRLTSKGHGQTQPIVDPTGLKGRTLALARSKNRRVEFVIMNPTPTAPPPAPVPAPAPAPAPAPPAPAQP